jgi:mRNA-degrading endonuclease RelE of RelBE toxin-antitoxin system
MGIFGRKPQQVIIQPQQTQQRVPSGLNYSDIFKEGEEIQFTEQAENFLQRLKDDTRLQVKSVLEQIETTRKELEDLDKQQKKAEFLYSRLRQWYSFIRGRISAKQGTLKMLEQLKQNMVTQLKAESEGGQ